MGMNADLSNVLMFVTSLIGVLLNLVTGGDKDCFETVNYPYDENEPDLRCRVNGSRGAEKVGSSDE
jgi:hypothetical protein